MSTDDPRTAETGAAFDGRAPINATRRKWLTGMLAGPAVVSLPRVASAGAMSSIATCMENYNSIQSVPYHVSLLEQDEYARKRVPAVCAFKGNPDSNGNGYQEAMLIETTAGKLVDQWYQTWEFSGFNKIIDPLGQTWKYDATLQTPDRLLLILGVVDEFGQFLTNDYEAMNAVPVTRSCYASMAVIM
jgi:hypothetical protein